MLIFVKYLISFEKLKVFKSFFVTITDDFLKKFIESINENIKRIDLNFEYYNSESGIKPSFRRLRNLECFSIFKTECSNSLAEDSINDILIELLNCKNLKYLFLKKSYDYYSDKTLKQFKYQPIFVEFEYEIDAYFVKHNIEF